MARNKTIAASRAKAKAEGLQLPLNTPAVAQAPAPESAAEVKRSPAKVAKPAEMPVEPTVAAKKVEPTVAAKKVEPTGAAKKVEHTGAAKKTARKTAKPAAQAVPVLKPAARSQAPAQPAVGKPSKRPAKIAGGNDSIAEGQVTIAVLESCGVLAAKGAESLGKEVVSLARGSLQAQFALTEALINAKTLQEALTLQGNFARESLGNMSEGFAKLAGMSMELSQSIMAPIHDRVRSNLT
jgi:Phasin protein